MTWKDAIIKILCEDFKGKTLHYKEITEEILKKGYKTTMGKTPENTVNRTCHELIDDGEITQSDVGEFNCAERSKSPDKTKQEPLPAINPQANKTKEPKFPINQILFGPPGTGKTYHTINKAVQIIDNDFFEQNKDNRTELKERFKKLKADGRVVFTTFHQSMSYEEFVEGLKPDEKDGQIFYEVKKGIFRQICEKAKVNLKENYVLIIDEINRGNIASIFGELITLIEPDKRQGKEEELFVKLPYSKDEFTVPKNLYIIGTMNTADRSVEALDSALRRRFVFEEMPPNETLLNDDFEEINLQKLLKQINIRIERLIDKDHKIGHSYFMNLSNIEDLRNTFKYKLIPLLEEYFYGDFVKIGLVLGKSFLNIEKEQDNIFKKIEEYDEDYIDFESRIIYKTTVPDEAEFINAVKNIYV